MFRQYVLFFKYDVTDWYSKKQSNYVRQHKTITGVY